MRKRIRSAITGRFLRREEAVPNTTVAETVGSPEVEVLRAVMLEQARNLRLQTGIQNLEWIAGELERAAGSEGHAKD